MRGERVQEARPMMIRVIEGSVQGAEPAGGDKCERLKESDAVRSAERTRFLL